MAGFTFTVTVGENWTNPETPRFISVAGRNNYVIGTTPAQYNTAISATSGARSALTKTWELHGDSNFVAQANFIDAYRGRLPTSACPAAPSPSPDTDDDLDRSTVIVGLTATSLVFSLISAGALVCMVSQNRHINNEVAKRQI